MLQTFLNPHSQFRVLKALLKIFLWDQWLILSLTYPFVTFDACLNPKTVLETVIATAVFEEMKYKDPTIFLILVVRMP